jgi:hypothetical protein
MTIATRLLIGLVDDPEDGSVLRWELDGFNAEPRIGS